MKVVTKHSHNLIPVIYEAGYISMLGSVNYKGLYTCSGSRHIQVGINVIQVAATIFVIPETPQICISFLQYFLLIQSRPPKTLQRNTKVREPKHFFLLQLSHMTTPDKERESLETGR